MRAAHRARPARSAISSRNRSRGRTTVSVALERGRGRRSRSAVEQGQLPEDVARLEADEDGLLAGLRGQRDLDLARHDDEQRVARVADVEDRPRRAGTAASASRRPPAPGRPHRGPRRTGRQRASRRSGGWRASSRHRSPPWKRPNAPSRPGIDSVVRGTTGRPSAARLGRGVVRR